MHQRDEHADRSTADGHGPHTQVDWPEGFGRGFVAMARVVARFGRVTGISF